MTTVKKKLNRLKTMDEDDSYLFNDSSSITFAKTLI